MTDVTKFIHTSYKEYSKYVLYSRAIPHMIDGLKPSQRKILYTAIRFAKASKLKTASLSGQVVAHASYHHGDASLNAAITNMVQDFNNNAPLLDGEGSFGSRLVPEAAAARYTYVRLSKNFENYFTDNEILNPSLDPEDPEPQNYLPLIPWVLVNGIRGIAVGFATEIQPRDPKELAKICMKYIKGVNVDKELLMPYYEGFKGTIQMGPNGIWECIGSFKLAGNKLNITELPIGYDREKFINILDKLKSIGKIVSYKDACSKKGFDFDIALKRGKHTKISIINMFKLRRALNENLTVINERGELEIFTNPIEILKRFCDYRLRAYRLRYKYYIKRDQQKVFLLDHKIRFIQMVINEDIDLKNTSLKKLKIILKDAGIDQVDEIVKMPIYKFCKDELTALRSTVSDLLGDIAIWKRTNYPNEFIKNLKEI